MSELLWTQLAHADAVAKAACERIVSAANTAITTHGIFRLVLAGGSTPEQCYQLLREVPAEWPYWHIYFGDERCLPVDNQGRNSFMAEHAWLDHVSIPDAQIHRIPAELGAKAGSQAYNKTIESILPFDLVLLGMGEDGHTASLFPGHEHPQQVLVHAVYNAPKAPLGRVSLSLHCLGQTSQLLYLITGEAKRSAVQQWQAGEQLPVASVKGWASAEVLIDTAAAY